MISSKSQADFYNHVQAWSDLITVFRLAPNVMETENLTNDDMYRDSSTVDGTKLPRTDLLSTFRVS